MKKRRVQLAAVVTVIGVVSLALSARAAYAQASLPTRAKNFSTWLVRVMDECTAPTVTVLDPGLPAAACPQANTVTDNALGMKKMKLRVTTRGKIVLNGTGFRVGDVLRVHLKLRITRTGVNTNVGDGESVSFTDLTVDCPKAPDAFAARLSGAVVGSTELGACVAPTSGLAQGNIEVLDASLVNVVSGKTVARPGVLSQ